jgi:anion-transporting  ArsA/GET3 family ATPase
MAGLLDQRLLVVSGKGGVGKSTLAAALALEGVRRGKRTLVYEVNADERVSGMLGHPPAGPEVKALEPNLWAVDVRPASALKEYALLRIKSERVYKIVFENRFVRYFLRFLPSLQELVMLGKLTYHLQETLPDGRPRFDLIVLDAPATGHAISYLSVPQVLLDTVPPGPLSDEVKVMRDLITDPAITQAILVSLPEEMPVNETIDLHRALTQKVKVTPGAVVLNQAVARRFTDEDLADMSQAPHAQSVAKAQTARAALTEDAKTRLSSLGLPVVSVPRLSEETFDRAAIEKVRAALVPQLEVP